MLDSDKFMAFDRLTRRRFLSTGGVAAVAAAGGSLFSLDAGAEIPMPATSGPLDEKLDGFIAAYMPAMNAPGLTLGLADSNGQVRTAGYGYANVDLRTPVTTSHLFQIGSITKSFVALVLLQLHDEGKLDLQKPVLDYLPGLPITTEFGPINIHHLLTHTSGLPDNLGIFQADPSARVAQGFKPGEHFHYCNTGFDILGLLASKLDGRPWRVCVQQRILDPLEMKETTGIITTSSRARSAVGYQAYWDDQVYSRQGKLAPAPNLVMDDTAGCIASTPGDMARYLCMLLKRGQGPKGRIVSEAAFTLFSTPYIKAAEFSPTASYGYGVAVDTLDGHKILRHTGGMVAFASSMHVDLDGGVAAFASINATQGYRPTAVTEYAVRLHRASRESKPLPSIPKIPNPLDVDNAADYAGTFTASDGRKLVFVAQGQRLSLVDNGNTIPLQRANGDSFLSTVEGVFATNTFDFGRKDTGAESSALATTPKPASAPAATPTETKPALTPSPVVEVNYGSEWFVNDSYTGPRTFAIPDDYPAFVGHYRSDSPWGGDIRVFLLKGQLVLSGAQLVRIGGSLFRVGDESWLPDTVEFLHVFEGKSRVMRFIGTDFWRIDVD